MKSKSRPILTPILIEVLRGERDHTSEVDPVVEYLRNAYLDGKTGANEGEYPRDIDIERVTWCDAHGKTVTEMEAREEDLLRRIIELERLCWEQGRRDAEEAGV